MAEDTKVDLKEFVRSSFLQAFQPSKISQLESFVWGIANGETDPRRVSFVQLEAMGTHPVVYLAERIVTGIIRRPDLYSVEHEDPKIQKETEEWLWPLLSSLLGVYARAFAYGSVPVVFNWTREQLKIEIPSGEGETRNKTLKNHTHYKSVHSIRPNEVTIESTNDDLDAVIFNDTRYGADRARVIRWDPEFNSFIGQSARRRAHRDYQICIILDQLEAVYLERSVDNPRVMFAPSGEVKIDGVEKTIPEHMNELLMTLRGSGSICMPSEFDANGKQLYDLKTLDLPDREGIWEKAINRREKRIMISYLALAGDGTAAAAKTLDGIAKEIVQDLAEWVAQDLTEIVAIVHAANHDPDKIKPAEVKATDVGKTGAKKILLETLRMIEKPEVTKWLDVKKALDRVGAPVLDEPNEPEPQVLPEAVAPVEGEATPNEPGNDSSSEREKRREDARTEDGEDDTGKDKGMSAWLQALVAKPEPSHTYNFNVEPARAPVVLVEPAAVTVNVEPTVVNLEAPVVTVEPAKVEVNVEPVQLEAPVVNITNEITVPEQPAPDVIVNVEPELKIPTRKIEIKRDGRGRISGAESEDA